jgi:hypothetical protein
MRTIKLILTLLAVALVAPLAGAAEGKGTTVRAILIVGSKEKGPSDRRLAPYEGNLRANLRYESYRFVDERSATVPPGGKASIEVGGRRVDLQNEGNAVFVRVGGGGHTVAPGGPPTVITAGGDHYVIAMAR